MTAGFLGFKTEDKKDGEVKKVAVNSKEEFTNVELFPYSVTNSGVFLNARSKETGDLISTKICLTGFNIVAKGDNIDTKELLFKIIVKDLKGRKHTVWKTVKDLLTRAGVLDLMNRDHFAFPESSAPHMVNLFESYIDNVKFDLPEEITVSRSGWKNNNELFVCGSTGYRKEGVETVLQLENNTADLYTKKGTIEGWKAGAEILTKYDAVRFKLYASCAPMLLNVLGNHSFIVEQYGDSGMLKSLSHGLCASMFGTPSGDLSLLLNAKSTQKGIEAFVGYNTDLPTFIDETSTNDKEIKDLVYTIANETGRSTSNIKKGYEMPKTWKTVVLTTGENPILPANAKMGELVRIIPLKEGVTEHLNDETIGTIENAIRENYGLVKDLVMKEIFENKKDVLRKVYDDYLSCFETPKTKNNTDTRANTDSRAKRFYATIATAGYVLENVFGDIGIEQKDPFEIVNKYYIENLITSTSFVPDHERALNAFYSWFAARKILFEENDERTSHDVYGKFDEEKREICVLPHILEKQITELGYNFKGCETNWKKNGKLLSHPHSKNNPKKEYTFKNVIINGIKTEVYKLPMQDDLDLENDDRENKNNTKRNPKTKLREPRSLVLLNEFGDSCASEEVEESSIKKEKSYDWTLYTKEMIDAKEYETWLPDIENGDTVYKNKLTGETRGRDLCTEGEFVDFLNSKGH